jgi:hypothetical protein
VVHVVTQDTLVRFCLLDTMTSRLLSVSLLGGEALELRSEPCRREMLLFIEKFSTKYVRLIQVSATARLQKQTVTHHFQHHRDSAFLCNKY